MNIKLDTRTVTQNESLDFASYINLNELTPGQQCTVMKVPDIAILPSLGLRIGKTLNMITRSIIGGPIIVGIDHRTVAIDQNIASEILVKRLSGC